MLGPVLTLLGDLSSVLRCPLQPHAKGQDAVVVVQLIQLRLLELGKADVPAVIGADDARGHIAWEVDQSDARRGTVVSP